MMKMCPAHWGKLRTAINERGIGHLVRRSGPEAVQSLTALSCGDRGAFDPLVAAFLAITIAAFEAGGVEMLKPHPDGSARCPVCEAQANGIPEDDWINGPADDALAWARGLGLTPSVQ